MIRNVNWAVLASLSIILGLEAIASKPITAQESVESPSPSVIELLEQTEPSQSDVTPNSEAQASESNTLIAVATQSEQLNLFLQAVKAADLEETLAKDGPYTIFAPTDAAFEQLPEDVLTTLMQPENQPVLRQILMYHVVSEKIMSKDLSSGELTSLGGGLSLQVSEDNVVVNDGTVVAKDLEANNGVIHLVNRVLIPEDISSRLESAPSDTQK